MPPALPPSQDPWYQPTPGYEFARPGTVLRVRSAPGSNPKALKNCSAVYNVLFASTNGHCKPSWAVTTLFVPQRTEAKALLSYQIPYNTSWLDSSPSRIAQDFDWGGWSYLVEHIEIGLQRGWFVNFPDHEGPLAAFGNGLVEAHTTLDSVRAVLRTGFGMDNTTTRTCLWGYSGGAVASTWAAQIQPQYAPELNIAGAALGAPVNLNCLLELSGDFRAGLIPQLLLGVTKEHPAASEYLLSCLKNEYRDTFLAALELGIHESFTTFFEQDIWRYFVNGRDVVREPIIRDLIRRANMGNHGVPDIPLFIYKSIWDETTPIKDTDDLVDKWVHLGVKIVYERYTKGSHLEASASGRPRAVEWMTKVLEGTYHHQGVTITEVDLLSEPEYL